MSYNGSGTFNINTTGQPVVAGTVISSSAFNALTTDLATGLTTAITKDGQTTTTARITFAQGITSSLVTDSSSVSTGSIITGGGVGIAKALYVGTTANVAGAVTLGGIATFSAQPIFSSLTASSAVADEENSVYDNIVLLAKSNVGDSSRLFIPAPVRALFLGDSDTPNPSATELQDVIDAFEAVSISGYVVVSARYTERREINEAIKF